MTLKQIRKWAAAVAAICLINVFLPFYGITAYAATARIAFSDPTASVGSEINVKMKITSSDNLSTADIMLAYDPGSLEFIEGTNAEGEMEQSVFMVTAVAQIPPPLPMT